MNKPRIGISIGDINGIGPEVIIKTLQHDYILEQCVPVIYGSSKVISYHKNIVEADFHFHSIKDIEHAANKKVNVINCWQDVVNISLGQANEEGGQYAAIALERAVMDLKAGKIDALVTAPINKNAMRMSGGFPFPGHTEYITQTVGAKHSLMLMVNDDIKIGLVTNHLPVSEVSKAIHKKLVTAKLEMLNRCLKVDFGKERPVIAVLGLNPHASDGGLMGDEEEKIIRPAVVEAKKRGVMAVGPFSADGFFGSGEYKKYDAVLAMYHDQGLIPFKLLSFGQGVNYTAGLNVIRTSPDHGTAYDLAGKNMADPSSFRHALFQAIDISRTRAAYMEMHENPLEIRQKKVMKGDEDEETIEDA